MASMTGFKTSIKSLLYSAGYYALKARLQGRLGPRLLILMYHELGEHPILRDGVEYPGGRPSREQFEAHVRVITQQYRVVTVAQAMQEFASEGRLAAQSVAITFDDGYESVYEIAFPILQKHNAPATVYVTTGWLNGTLSLWWEIHAAMFTQPSLSDETMSQLELLYNTALRPDGPRGGTTVRRVINRAEALLRALPDERREAILAEQRKILGVAQVHYEHPRPLSWAQVKELHQAGWEIGGHSKSHINLAHSALEVVQQDLTDSTKELAEKLGDRPPGFAYTYGRDNEGYVRLEGLLKELGYTYACTAWSGVNDAQTPCFALQRNTVPSTTVEALIGRSLALDFCAASGPDDSGRGTGIRN